MKFFITRLQRGHFWRFIIMSGNKKRVIDFPDGLLFMGPEDDPYLEKPRKRIDFQGALEYARQAEEDGRSITFEEMQQFVLD